MSSPDCKRQKLADDVNSVAKMSKVSPTKDAASKTENRTSTASTSKERIVIKVNAKEFEEVANSDGFVDRTMLIEELLKGKEEDKTTQVMIFAPSKFGKTINLDMIRLFCDIEDKNKKTKEIVATDPTMQDLRSNPSKNMKVFLRQFEDREYEECLILKQEQFVIQHFGRHPVVLLNFKDCMAKYKSEAICFCAEQVCKAYEENIYLENSKELHNSLKKTCTNWINYTDVDRKSLSEMEVASGLKNLIKSLRMHWGRKPVLLVDEVDKPCVKAMEKMVEEEGEKAMKMMDKEKLEKADDMKVKEVVVHAIGTFITDVICSILKTSDEQLELEAALVTGICKFMNSGMSSMDNTTPVYFLSHDRFSKYYGLTAQEVDTLVKRFCGSQADAEKIISEINARYNGYYLLSSSGDENKKDTVRYCLFSVLNYMENTNAKDLCFWSDGGFFTEKLLPGLKKSDEIMSAIQKLFYDDSGTIEITYQEAVHVAYIVQLYYGKRDLYRDEVFNYFLQRGYLAHNVEKPIENVGMSMKINVRIPNLEIKEIYKNMFKLYYGSFEEGIQSKLTHCGEIFKLLPTVDSTEFKGKLDKLCENLKCIFKYMRCYGERTICSHILAILKHYAEYEKGETEYAVKYFDDNCKQNVVYIDVWGRHGKFAIIFEVKFNYSATGEPGKIGDTTKSSLAAAEDIVKLLPGKKRPEGGCSGKAGTGRDLEVLKSEIENYVLIGLAVDGDYTTHMLVFRDTSDWNSVIQVNPENHVKQLISTLTN